jgi:hypothetical protein
MNVYCIVGNHWLLYDEISFINQNAFAGLFKKFLYKFIQFAVAKSQTATT